ncbi:PREDICTED: cyclin-T1-5-like isoform X2 [Nelumbo nucifera]|uniref:Cyclin-T1-5-like isoform X2 n=1 Tax=Nelumbo nucifera TaxID=4432 RepID=A0A1U8A3F0_NELNU|nr:PREDICTED: cyclin-T1-5-like isoform X2 [Nelumbo nucifera]
MAGLLPGDPSHHGMVESGPYSFSQDKPEHAGRWYLSRREIEENSPSRKDGIDLKKETYLRKSYCTFLQDLGMRLKVPQVTIATAIIFCHRFFLRQSHAKNDRRTIATVCMFLAGKVEETPRPLKDVILVSYEIIHKKDPAAVQRIKQKEVYEQQKELILLGERVVLATLGFDLNVHHPYKPLVEAIKKFKVAQNALAQVAWNFVNDGLRTSLCLQFKPHHIAAGAIFLAAKFLKVKLPSDGEKVWWQEFDVTPRQLEEVSNQMLELYEQNRVPPSQGSEMEGSAQGGPSHRAQGKTPSTNDEPVSANGHVQAGGASTAKPGASVPSSRATSDQSYAENQGGSQRNNQNRSNDHGSTETRSVILDQKVDAESKERWHSEHDPLPYNRDIGEASNRSKYGSDGHAEEDQERNGGRSESAEPGELKNEGAPYKSSNAPSRTLEFREGPVGQSPQDVIKKIDKDKVKAALEKRRKSRGDVTRKMELMDEDDLIERELEDGVELAVEDEKNKRERRQSWSKPSNRSEFENPVYGKDHNDAADGKYPGREGQSSWGPDGEIVEEGEVSLYDEAEHGRRSPKLSNRKRKAASPPDKQLEGKHRHDYTPGYHHSHNHHDLMEDGNRMGRHGYAERDHKRHAQENHV